MLKALRKKETAKKILIALAIIIIPAFVFWGAGSFIRDRHEKNFAGKIFGKTIRIENYMDSLNACQIQAIIRFGENFYKMKPYLNLEAEAWDRLILLHEAKLRKIKIPDSEVIQEIQGFPFFQKDGKFDRQTYNHILDYAFRISPREFEEQIRQSLMFKKIYEQVTKPISISEDDVRRAYEKQNEKIKVSYIYISPKDFQGDVQINDEQIQDYFQKNKQAFRKPPMINIQYINLNYPKDAKEEDKESIQEKIKQIKSQTKSIQDFTKIAEEQKLTIKETGLFSLQDPIPGIGLSLEFMQAASELKPDEVSEPVCTAVGCHILTLKEKKESYLPELEEVKQEVEKVLIEQEAKKIAEDKAKDYLEKIQEIYKNNPDEDFNKIAKNLKLETKQTPLFNYGQYISGVGAKGEFQDIAFNLRKGEKNVALATMPQGFYILKLDEYIPIDEEKFKEEKDLFGKNLLTQKKNEFFNDFFEDLKFKANLEDYISQRLTSAQ